jgi:hypothetical protein
MRILSLALLILVAPGFSWGADESPGSEDNTLKGWYLGGGYALTNVFWVEPDYGLSQTERGDSDSGFIINGGYRFNRYLAIELGYLDGGEPTFQSVLVNDEDGFNIIDIEAAQETEAIELSGVVVLPFWKIWEVYGKFGASFWDATSRQTLTPESGVPINRTIDESGIDFLIGVGVGVTVWKNLHLRFEAQAFRTKDELLGLDLETVDDLEARFDAFLLEAHWRFGDQWQQ